MGPVSNLWKKIDHRIDTLLLGPLDELKEARREKARARRRGRQISSDPQSWGNWSPDSGYNKPERRTTEDICSRTSDLHYEVNRSRRSEDARYHGSNTNYNDRSSGRSEDPKYRKIHHHQDERKRTKSEDMRYTRFHSDPKSSKVAGFSVRRAKSVGKRGDAEQGGNTRSEGNLPRAVQISPGDRERGRDTSPRKSEPVLVRARSKSREGASCQIDDHKSPNRSRFHRRQNQAADAPPVPPIPQKWTGEAQSNAKLPFRPKPGPEQQLSLPPDHLQALLYQQVQWEAAQQKAQKPVFDWENMNREYNEKMKHGEIEKKHREDKKRREAEEAVAAVRKWEEAEGKRREKEREEQARRREKEKADKERIDRLEMEVARLSQAAREREKAERETKDALLARKVAKQQKEEEAARQREKHQKRRKAEEAEKKANAARMLKAELARKESVRRDNEAARLRAFSPKEVGGSELQRRANVAPQAETGGYVPRGRALERQDTHPVPQRPAKDPINLRRAAPLTVENLVLFQGDFVEGRHTPVSELGRLPIADNTRTFVVGYATAASEDGEKENKLR